jgi:hypothetical protein
VNYGCGALRARYSAAAEFLDAGLLGHGDEILALVHQDSPSCLGCHPEISARAKAPVPGENTDRFGPVSEAFSAPMLTALSPENHGFVTIFATVAVESALSKFT